MNHKTIRQMERDYFSLSTLRRRRLLEQAMSLDNWEDTARIEMVNRYSQFITRPKATFPVQVLRQPGKLEVIHI